MKIKICKLALVVTSCLFAFALLTITIQAASASAWQSRVDPFVAHMPLIYAAKSGLASPPLQSSSPMTVDLWAKSEIDFYAGNDGKNPLEELPYLILYQNGTLTPRISRTLTVIVSNIEVPPGGVTVTLEVRTQHNDPDLLQSSGGTISQTIAVWRESDWIDNPSGVPQIGATAFTRAFTPTVMSGTVPISTPTDYFQYAVLLNGVIEYADEFAFLMNEALQQQTEFEPVAMAEPISPIVFNCFTK